MILSLGKKKKKKQRREKVLLCCFALFSLFFVQAETVAQFLFLSHTKNDQNNPKTLHCYAKVPLALMTALALFTFPPSFAFQVKTHD